MIPSRLIRIRSEMPLVKLVKQSMHAAVRYDASIQTEKRNRPELNFEMVLREVDNHQLEARARI